MSFRAEKRRARRARRWASVCLSIPFTLLLAPGKTHAQQSLFNVPSAKLTPPGELFFQEQLNISREGESNLTTDVGLGRGFELGLNVMHVRLYPSAPLTVSMDDPSNDAFMANMQWIASATHWLSVAAGTQQGLSARDGKPGVHWVGFGFGALRFEPAGGRYGGYVLGGYYGTKSATGKGPQGGGMMGFEIPLVGEHLAVCVDWMVGTNRSSVAVLGLQVMPVPRWGWQISLGAQLPAFAPESGPALVLELTHTGSRPKEPTPRPSTPTNLAKHER